MSNEFDTKLDTLISLFGRFVQSNNGSNDLGDVHVRTEWSNLRNLLNNRPVNLSSLYSFLGKVQEKPTQEPSSPGLKVKRLGSGSSPLNASRDMPDINKKRLLDDVKQLLSTFKSNTSKIFKP